MIIIDPAVAQYADISGHEELVREWKAYCHDGKLRRVSVIIDYDRIRFTGRWGCEKRKRPFVIKSANTLEVISSFKSIDAAMRRAAEISALNERIWANR